MLFPFTIESRRLVLRIAAIGVIVYAIVVLVWANLIPYLGIQVFGTQVSVLNESPAFGRAPAIGDKVLQIGDGPPIQTWPHFLNTVANLRERYHNPSAVGKLSDLSSFNGNDAALPDGRRLVRIRLRAASAGASPASGAEYDAWYHVRELPIEKTLISVFWAALQSAIFWMGWRVYRRRPKDDAAALFFLGCILTVGAYLGGFHWLQLATQPALIFVFAICATALPMVHLHFYLLFPYPKRFVLRHPRLTLLFLYGIPGAFQIAILTSVGMVVSTFRNHQHAVEELVRYLAIRRGLVWVYVGLAAAAFACGVAAVADGFRHARVPAEKNQMRWILAGALASSMFVAYSLFLAWGDPDGVVSGGATWAMFGASLVFSGAHAFSIARYRLSDVESLLQRGWIYLGVSFLGGLAYYGLLFLLAFFLPQFAGVTSRPEGLLVSASIILILLMANTVRGSIQKVLDRRFFREKHLLERAARRLDRAVGQRAVPDAAWRRWLAVAADVINAQSAACYRRDGEGDFFRVESLGDRRFPDRIAVDHPLIAALESGNLQQTNPGPVLPGDDAAPPLRKLGAELAQPLVAEETLLGFLLFGPRAEGLYDAEQLTFLGGSAELAGLAIVQAESQSALERINAELQSRVAKVARRQERQDLVRRAAERGDEAGDFGSLRGAGPAIRELIGAVRKVAGSQATVLIRGESGTGKTLLADLIHRNSPRAGRPFIVVHCASLSPGVLESELFGHVKGAFTGAHRDKVGRFELADGGTLFLDEIGDVSLDIQTKLLRVLQETTFEPVGSGATRKVDVRLIAATNQPLEELIRQGRFREDLFYRLNVIGLRTPPLRDRPEDVVDLALHFLRRFADQAGKEIEGFDEEALDLLQEHAWPGNIRELENAISRAVVMADGSTIGPDDLPGELAAAARSAPRATLRMWGAGGASPAGASAPYAAPMGAAPAFASPTAPAARSSGEAAAARSTPGLAAELDALERDRLIAALTSAGGNKSYAARLLGFRRSTFCSKLKKYGIE